MPGRCRAGAWPERAGVRVTLVAVMRRLPLVRLTLACLATVALVATPAQAGTTEPPTTPSSVVGGARLDGPGVVVAAGTPRLPAVAAQTWLVADATSGRVLAAKGAHVRVRPASTLKTLTALTLLPLLDATDVHRVTDADVRVEGSKAGLQVNGAYTVDQLFTALFLPSGNDAATALANAAGGVPATVARMNEVADRLHAYDTTAVNPSGLDADGQLTSAYDLALVARAGLARDDFRHYAGLRTADLPGKGPARPDGTLPTFQIQNQNRLLMHGYPGALGVKTGYTTLAGRTFVGAAERDGHLLLVTLARIGQPTEDAARLLLDWGFAAVARPGVTGVGTLVAAAPEQTTVPSPSPSAVPTASPSVAAASAAPAPQGRGWVSVGAVALGLLAVGLLVRRHRRPRRSWS